MLLLIFTDPNLPAIYELPETFCHISVRGQENTVTMQDRRPWVRDITGYLADLTSTPGIAGPGVWAILSKLAGSHVSEKHTLSELRNALERAEADALLLRQENEHLRHQRIPSIEAAV